MESEKNTQRGNRLQPLNQGMGDGHHPGIYEDRPAFYEIRVKGHLGTSWLDWFEGLTITLEENGDTLLTGVVADQAALHGLLKKIRNTGMPLLSVNAVESH